MARFYSDENVPSPVVQALRRLGHDVLTSYDAGNANRAVPDSEVLSFAASQSRILITLNRRDFVKLHRSGAISHAGIVACSVDIDFERQALAIDASVRETSPMAGKLLLVRRHPVR
jgi:predicted nuclease of predicted toxin-antitoxin system